jgi:hypothetical protein
MQELTSRHMTQSEAAEPTFGRSAYLVRQAGEVEVVQINISSSELMKVRVRSFGATASVKHVDRGTEHAHHGCKYDQSRC